VNTNTDAEALARVALHVQLLDHRLRTPAPGWTDGDGDPSPRAMLATHRRLHRSTSRVPPCSQQQQQLLPLRREAATRRHLFENQRDEFAASLRSLLLLVAGVVVVVAVVVVVLVQATAG
jgi:hypothetical protein